MRVRSSSITALSGAWYWLVVGLMGACAPPEPDASVSAPIGEPLPELTPAEVVAFEAGRALFRRPFSADEGLGPRFNENACNACHTFPTDGGTGETSVRKATRAAADGTCDPLVALGGENLRIQVTPHARSLGAEPRLSVAEATHTARFTIPFVYGLGLVEAIPLSTLEALADPDDVDGDGISGRIGRDAAGRPARFGRKADIATLHDFTVGAFRLEMGLTSEAAPLEASAGDIPPTPPGSDPVSDPELSVAQVADVVSFMRYLAPPAPAQGTEDEWVTRGRALFGTLGCPACHVPVLTAGPSESAAIDGKSVGLYSDLLLHDMGPGLEGTCGPGAATTEYRTEPLMGLRYREVFLHDGRVTRVRDAILRHGGEAAAAREAFEALDRVTQDALLRFLGTL